MANTGYRHPFLVGTHFLGGVGDVPRTLTELAMSQLSAEIRRQPDWWTKEEHSVVSDRVWVVKMPSGSAEIILSNRQITYVVDELAGYKALRDTKNQCEVSCFERIWESGSLLDDATMAALAHELSQLDAGQIVRNHVRHFIDPHLYPLVYKRSLVSFPRSCRLSVFEPPHITDIYTTSQQFALLPTDILVPTANHEEIQFLSYINNVDPILRSLHSLLQRALTRFIPLFEHTLTDLHLNNPLRLRIPGTCRYTIWEEPDPPEHSDDEEGWSVYERDLRKWTQTRPIVLPDVPISGYPGTLHERKHIVSLKGRKLQIIIRASEFVVASSDAAKEIVISPWHVEGMKNERIVACGVYYPSLVNIDDLSLQFRTSVQYPRGFTAGDSSATLRTWGFHEGDACHQYIGSVPIRQGLGVVFPNIYQHRHVMRLSSSRGTDCEGRCTVLSFLLVDPDIPPILSTTVVPPQQSEWIRKAVNENLDLRLPVEIVEDIMDKVDGLMSASEAEQYRTSMLEERESFRVANDNYHFCIPFDVWDGPG